MILITALLVLTAIEGAVVASAFGVGISNHLVDHKVPKVSFN